MANSHVTRRAAGWFSSAERWFQTRRSIESYRHFHREHPTELYLLFCGTDRDLARIDVPADVRVVMPHQMHEHFRRNVARVGLMGGFPRPLIVDHMLNQGHDCVMAFDGDTEFFDDIDDLWDALTDEDDAIATPHRLYAPPRDGKVMCLEQFALCGNYNVGLVGFSNTPNARQFVDWWLHESIDAPECNMSAGRFAEQGWFRFVGDYMDNVHICRDQGVNYAFWRYDTPDDLVVDAYGNYSVWHARDAAHVPLRLMHYGALDFNDMKRVAIHHNRCEAGPGLMHLFEGYKQRVLG